jgi:NADH-quinone oxidoreductase subunit I
MAVLAGFWSVLVGMWITLKRSFRRPITVQYPEEKKPVMPGFRGALGLNSDPATGQLKCTACGICARNCPTGAIQVTGKPGADGKKHVDTFTADLKRCIYCGLCVESCAFGSLTMSPEYEMAAFDKDQLVLGKEQLAVLGRQGQEQEAKEK